MAFSCNFYVEFARTSAPLGLQKTLEVCSISIYIIALKYDHPSLPEAENSMTHHTGKAENIVAHPLLYLLTGP